MTTSNVATEIVGSSPAILAAVQTADQIAGTDMPVLIAGETGTGKELFARHIHTRSGRPGQLIGVNCGALPADLTESLLFGHDRGAFTGAVKQSAGLVVEAHRGTLFLDELSSLRLSGQAALLRVLETGEVRRIGASGARISDFRLVATVQDDFSSVVAAGGFRRDLLQRIAGVIIRLPRLDDRPGDVPVLARHFATLDGLSITAEAEAILDAHSWPGNVRELRWAVARAALFAGAGRIGAREVTQALDLGPQTLLTTSDDRRGFRARIGHLRAACEAHAGDPTEVAKALGVGRSTMYRWLNEASIELRDFSRNGRLRAAGER
jgi:transcriptional regulator with PAS, ATPase and Fis domain